MVLIGTPLRALGKALLIVLSLSLSLSRCLSRPLSLSLSLALSLSLSLSGSLSLSLSLSLTHTHAHKRTQSFSHSLSLLLTPQQKKQRKGAGAGASWVRVDARMEGRPCAPARHSSRRYEAFCVACEPQTPVCQECLAPVCPTRHSCHRRLCVKSGCACGSQATKKASYPERQGESSALEFLRDIEERPHQECACQHCSTWASVIHLDTNGHRMHRPCLVPDVSRSCSPRQKSRVGTSHRKSETSVNFR